MRFSAPKVLSAIFAAFSVIATCAAATQQQQSPATPPPAANAPAGNPDGLVFAGVSTIGRQSMIDLYDTHTKSGVWVKEGETANGVTVVKFDASHNQVTIRRDGAESVLPLRPEGAVVNGPAAIPGGSAATPASTAPEVPKTEQARKEEEARMLVSDLLEIGMAQRKAYEEKLREAQKGQKSGPAPPPAPASAPSAQSAGK